MSADERTSACEKGYANVIGAISADQLLLGRGGDIMVHSPVLDVCSIGCCLCDMVFCSLYHSLPNSIHARIVFFLQRL